VLGEQINMDAPPEDTEMALQTAENEFLIGGQASRFSNVSLCKWTHGLILSSGQLLTVTVWQMQSRCVSEPVRLRVVVNGPRLRHAGLSQIEYMVSEVCR
jgi:hypothetical protein